MFAKTIIVKIFKNYFVFYQKYSCQDKYPAGYPVSGLNRIPVPYPAKTVSGASLEITVIIKERQEDI
jgi:hypothetical protein